MIVGTAGHIDHGKTTLVRALTGVDTDRLPEEKKRGISIELGYAYLSTPQGDRIGFIDVPGHERLVHTMLAGATGIDYALLLVAADDGVMPQTREHLAVLSLLGIARGAVVVTKVDRADELRVQAVLAEVEALLQHSALRGAPVRTVSAYTGQGVQALKDLLCDAARGGRTPAGDAQAFRLAVDRAFTLDGVGTVVTGTAHAGRVQVGDELLLLTAPTPRPVRVRSLHAQNAIATTAGVGQRVALALAGVAKDDVARGLWLCAPEAAITTQRVDAALSVWHAEAKPMRSGTTVHVHLGASDTLASVALLDAGDVLPPGASARVQLVLRAPIAAWHGDRVVLRDASASRTLAGGVVLDPQAPARYRRTPQRLALLDALQQPDVEARLQALLSASPTGIDLQAWRRAEGRSEAVPELPAGTLRASDAHSDWALAAAHEQPMQQGVLAALAAFHERQPDELGPDAARLRRVAAPRLAEPLWRAVLASLLAQQRVVQRGAQLHLPEHGVRLSAVEERIAQKVLPRLIDGGFDPPWVRDLANDAREPEALMRTVLARLARHGELHQVVKDLYYPAATLQRLAVIVRELAARDSEVRAAAFRDATGLGRKRAIQLLEFFDRMGLLRRVQDAHRLRSESRLFVTDEAA